MRTPLGQIHFKEQTQRTAKLSHPSEHPTTELRRQYGSWIIVASCRFASTGLQPGRNVSFIIAWDDSSEDPPYNWLNGTNLYNAYINANESGQAFPIIPPVATMLNRNYTLKPTLFGCDTNLTTTRSTASPIVLYMANAPYSAYTNYTGLAGNFTTSQFNEIFVNGFDQFTQGNGTLDAEWTTCLGCAVIGRSLNALEMQRTAQFVKCMQKYY